MKEEESALRTTVGWLTKRSTHGKWQRRWFVLRGRWVSYYRSTSSTTVSGRVVLDATSTVEISELRPNTWKLVTSKRTIHVQTSDAGDLVRWMSAIGAAITLEREFVEGSLLFSDSDSETTKNADVPTSTHLTNNYSDIVKAKVRESMRLLPSTPEANPSEETRGRRYASPRQDVAAMSGAVTSDRRPLWQPMVGLFNQLMDHLGSPQKSSVGAEMSIDESNSSLSSQKREQERKKRVSWGIGRALCDRDAVPPIVRHCCEYLLANNRVDTEGIFRVPGQSTTVSILRDRLSSRVRVGDAKGFESLVQSHNESTTVANDGSSTNRHVDVHNVATLLKASLSGLPKAVIPEKCYAHLLRAQRESATASSRLSTFRAILSDSSMVPYAHFCCLTYLLAFFQDVSKRSEYNRMKASNLAVCFAPTLLRPPQPAPGANPATVMGEICTGIEVIKTLIEHARDPILIGSPSKTPKASLANILLTRPKGLRGRRRPSLAYGPSATGGHIRVRSMTLGVRQRRSRRDALLDVASDEEETRRRRESSSDRSFFVTHASIRSTSDSPTKSSFVERRRLILNANTRTLSVVPLSGRVSVTNILDVHRHDGFEEEDSKGGGNDSVRVDASWQTLTLSLSMETTTKENEGHAEKTSTSGRLLHFSVPPADAGRWATSLGALAKHGVFASANKRMRDKERASDRRPATPLQAIDVNVNDNERTMKDYQASPRCPVESDTFESDTMIMHGFMKLLVDVSASHVSRPDNDSTGQTEWRKVHVTLTDDALEWVFCPRRNGNDDINHEKAVQSDDASSGIVLYLENVRIGPSFVGSGSCFTLSSALPTYADTKSPLPLVVRMTKHAGALWNTLLRSCSSASSLDNHALPRHRTGDATNAAAAAARRRRRRRRRSSVVNHAMAARLERGDGTYSLRRGSIRRFPSDRRSLHMSVKYNVEWECDGNDNRCAVCSVKFTLFRRRHHCRLCGNLVCDSCSQSRLPTMHSGTLERACDECVKAKTDRALAKEEAPVCQADASSKKDTTSLVDMVRNYEARARANRRALAAMKVHFSSVPVV